jgi:hypothetical protein
MNEGGGERVNDISGNSNVGTLTGIAPSATSGWTGGPRGRAITFDAANDYINVPHSASLSITGAMSMVLWLNADYASNYLMLFVKDSGTVPAPYQAYIQAGTGLVELWRGNGVSQANLASTAAIPSKTWCMIAMTHDGTTGKHYLNGAPNGSGALSVATSDAGTALVIGQRAGSYWMKGGFANLRLYNRVLDSCEVAQLYADPLAGARAPVSAARYFVPATISPPAAPPTADRLWNRGYVGRIFRRGEKG